MSALDIIIFSLGGIIIVAYATIQIRRTLKWRKKVKQYVADGMTLENAKIKANQEFNYKNKKKKEKSIKEIEDDIFTE